MLVFENRCASTTTSTGAGDLTLSAVAIPTYQTIDAKIAVGNSFDGWIEDTVSGLWECGRYTLTAANTLARTTVYGGSNGTSPVNFTAGTKRVTVSVSAEFLNTVATKDGINTISGVSRSTQAALTTGATLTPDASRSFQTFTTTSNFTIALPTNRPTNALNPFIVKIIYTGAHSCTSVDAGYTYEGEFTSGSAPTFGGGASGTYDLLMISDDGTNASFDVIKGFTS